MWTKIFILALSNLKHGKLKLSINENHHFISGKFPGPTANLKIEDKNIIKKGRQKPPFLIRCNCLLAKSYVRYCNFT